MDMLEIICYFIVGWFCYRLFVSWLELKELERNVEEAVELIEERAKHIIVVFERVKHNDEDVILCYDTENNFIAQGTSKEEVIKKAQTRFPSKNIASYKNEELQWINTETVNKSTTVDSNTK